MNKEKFTVQMKEMLAMQEKINSVVNPDWREANYPWYRAIWIECAELMDHYGWKWWKKQEPDLEQVKLELVDIWHFMLSIFLQQERGRDISLELTYAHHAIFNERKYIPLSVLEIVEDFTLSIIRHAHTDRGPFPRKFFALCSQVGLDFDELYRLYIGKNVLNIFRQEHGYKEGTYEKTWVGKEDNVWLMEVIAGWQEDDGDFAEYVGNMLGNAYTFRNASDPELDSWGPSS